MNQAGKNKVQKTDLEETKLGRQYASDAAIAFNQFPGFKAAPSASYRLYREMLSDATIALARAMVTGAVMNTPWHFETSQAEDHPMLNFIESQLQPLREFIIKECLRALDYGWQGFEKVYAYRDDRLELKQLKVLAQDQTEILLEESSGAFAGLRQGDISLSPEKCFLFTHDRQLDDLYGRSRLENIREVWSMWRQANESAARYDRKVAGVMPVVHYPPGQSYDISGHGQDNFEIARRLLEAISSGKGLAVPQGLGQSQKGQAFGKGQGEAVEDWRIELLEDRASRQPGFLERLRYLDALKFRGYLRPERSALEGSRGTLAEAKAHQDVALSDTRWLTQDLIRHVNWYLVDPLLRLNFGSSAMGKVWVTVLDDETGKAN